MAFRVLEALRHRPGEGHHSRAARSGQVRPTRSRTRSSTPIFWVGGMPTSAVTDLGATPGHQAEARRSRRRGRRDGQEVRAAVRARTRSRRRPIRARTAPSQIVTVWNVLVADANMPDQVAYDIVKTMFDRKEDLVRVHDEAKNFDLKNQSNTGGGDPLPSRGDEVLRGEGRQAELAPRAPDEAPPSGACVGRAVAAIRGAHGRDHGRAQARPATGRSSPKRALKKAEEYIEAGRRARLNRLPRRLGRVPHRRRGRDVALPPVRGVRDHARRTTLRYAHVGFVLFLVFLLFRSRSGGATASAGSTRARDRRRRHASLYAIAGRRRFPRPQHRAEPARHGDGHRARSCWCWRRRAARPAGSCRSSASSSSRTRWSGRTCRDRGRHRGYDIGRLVGVHVHDARGHLRDRGRRLVVADHPVHDLRRVPPVLRRGQVLHRFLVRRDGRQAHRRRPHDRARVVPARRAVGLAGSRPP